MRTVRLETHFRGDDRRLNSFCGLNGVGLENLWRRFDYRQAFFFSEGIALTPFFVCCLSQRMEAWEQEAIRRVLAGDREEYRVLMERHLPAVLRMTMRVTGNVAYAEEAAQEAFLLAYNKLPRFREQAAFGTWVYRIAMNCSLDLLKRRARDAKWNAGSLDSEPGLHAVAVSSGPTPEAALLDAEAHVRRERAMAALTARENTAFVLRHVEDQPIEVIAQALGINANTARQTLFRAVSKLRRELAPAQNSAAVAVSPSPVFKELR